MYIREEEHRFRAGMDASEELIEEVDYTVKRLGWTSIFTAIRGR